MIYEDIMLVRANGISEALLSTGAYLPEGKGGCTLFLFCLGKLDCVRNVGEQVQTGCLGVGLISQRGRVACAAIDRGGGGQEVWPPCSRAANLCTATNLFSAINYVPTPFC